VTVPGADGELRSDGAPQFFRDPAVDRLMEVVMELAAELWVSRRRERLLEAALVERGVLAADALELRVLSDSERADLRAERDALLGRVFGVLAR
jgi:hypothetical protein